MKQFRHFATLALCGAFSICASAQATNQSSQAGMPQTGTTSQTPTNQSSTSSSGSTGTQAQAENTKKNTDSHSNHLASGQKQKITGVIIQRDPDSFIVRDMQGTDTTVVMSSATKVSEAKSNPFRSAKTYPETSLLRGLTVEIEGRGDTSGNLAADKIKFKDTAYQMARTVESRVTPVEGRVGEAEGRLTAAESNAQRLSGQIDELSTISNAARGGAKAAQETADAAIAGVNSTNERIGMLDDYDARQSTSVQFKVGSAILSQEAMTALDNLATQAKTQKGFVIQIAGFASADGSEELNRRLSQKRADAVVQYLAEKQNVPLRRIVLPFGYGEMNPAADNSTREGREQNRRVEVTVMVSKGLNSAAPEMTPTKTAAADVSQTKDN